MHRPAHRAERRSTGRHHTRHRAARGAIQIDEDWRYNDGQARRFQGTKRGTEFHVDIIGWQDRDGSIVRHTVIDRDIFIDSTAAARELAADLLAAADEIDALEPSSAERADGPSLNSGGGLVGV